MPGCPDSYKARPVGRRLSHAQAAHPWSFLRGVAAVVPANRPGLDKAHVWLRLSDIARNRGSIPPAMSRGIVRFVGSKRFYCYSDHSGCKRACTVQNTLAGGPAATLRD